MVDWQEGGCTGSIRRWARSEVRKHFRDNPTARRVRYSLSHRTIRQFFRIGTFSRFVIAYVLVDLSFVAIEAFASRFAPSGFPTWAPALTRQATDLEVLLKDISGILIAAQVGVLAVITLALALVTLIAQSKNSETDIRVYYHESMAFEVVASCLGLVAILVTQFTWPLQWIIHRAGFGVDNLLFEFILHGLHLAWLLANLAAVAYFISTTFGFVQRSSRVRLRNRYTRNVVFPHNLSRRLCEERYSAETMEFEDLDDKSGQGRPSFTFGFDFGEPYDTELQTDFRSPTLLEDLRLTGVRWVLRRWSIRCGKAESGSQSVAGLRGGQSPSIWFVPHLGYPMNGKVAWCRRRGGVPLNSLEKFVLRRSFVFKRSKNAV